MSIRVMIVDDHAVFREGLRAILHGRADMEIVAEAASAGEALARGIEAAPHVILLDIGLPDGSGLECLRAFRERLPEAKVVMLTVYEDREHVTAAIRAGALGYLSKTSPLDEIVRGVVAASAGQLLLGASVAKYIREPDAIADSGSLQSLTLRETQLMRLLAGGASTEEMAERLGIAPKTVRNYLSGLYAKLGARDRGQAALAAHGELHRGGAGREALEGRAQR